MRDEGHTPEILKKIVADARERISHDETYHLFRQYFYITEDMNTAALLTVAREIRNGARLGN